jgi:WD40 repeat protein
LALEAHRRDPGSFDALGALQGALTHTPQLGGFFYSEGDGFTAPSISPDGTQFVVGVAPGGADVYDIATRRRIARLDTGEGRPVATWSPTGERIAVASGRSDGNTAITMWDAHSHALIAGPLDVHGSDGWSGAVFSADGEYVAEATIDGQVYVLRAETGEVVAHRELGVVAGRPAFDPSGQRLYVPLHELPPAPDLFVLDARSLTLISQGRVGGIAAWTAAVSPDGTMVAVGDGDGGIALADATTLDVRRRLERHRSNVYTLAFTADGKRLASSAQDGTALVWDVEAGQVAAGPFTNPGDSSFASLSRDGLHLVQASVGGRGVVWDLSGRQPLARPWGPPGTNDGFASPDGGLVATVEFPGDLASTVVRLLDATTGDELGNFAGGPMSQVAFSPDSRRLAVWTNDGIQLLDVSSMRASGPPIPVPVAAEPGNFPFALAWSPDGGRIGIGFVKGQLAFADVAAGRLVAPPIQTPGTVSTIFFSPDGRRAGLTSGLVDGRLFDTDTGRPVDPVLCSNTCAILFGPSGRVLTAGTSFTVHDEHTLEPIGTSGEIMSQGMSAATFRPDGRRAMVAIAGAFRLVAVEGDNFTPFGETFLVDTSRGYKSSGFLADNSVIYPGPGDKGLLRFDVDETHWPQIACDLVGRNLSRAEWDRYVGGTYHTACTQFPPGE